MSFSDTLEGQVLDHLFGLATWTAPTHLYIGLSTADPGDDGATLAEPAGNAYARVLCDPGAANWTRTNSTVDNDAAIEFPQASGSWGTLTYVCFFTAASGGTPLLSYALTVGKSVAAGQVARFSAGTLDTTQG